MAKQYTNFYETLQEARMRLDQTVVLYDGKPYLVLCITDHKPDGIFRVYLDPLPPSGRPYSMDEPVPYEWHDEPLMSKGQKMDQWMETFPNSPILRKQMNSPLFNKFRPFPLGMANSASQAVYVERSPARHTQQGLTGSMLIGRKFVLSGKAAMMSVPGMGSGPSGKLSLLNPTVYSAIVGEYPSIDQVLTNLTDEEVVNPSVAFHRDFALVRGPLDLLFLAYRTDVVGYLPYNNLETVKIAPQFDYVKESIDELGMFNSIV